MSETQVKLECTRESPWNGELVKGQRVSHSETEEVGEQEDGYPGGDIVRIRCKNCGHTWKTELPQ